MADFGLVQQLADLRGAFSGPPTSVESYAPPQVATPGLPSSTAYEASPSAPAGAAGSLTQWGKYKFASSALPHFQQLASQFPGLRLSSGYRDPAHNAAVNGVKNSWHLKGRAADFSGSAGDMQRAAAWAKANGAQEVLIHNAGSGQHLHVAY